MIRLIFCFLFLCSFTADTPGWMTDFESAKSVAREHHKPILLNFSGSDWCLPCIRLKRDVFESSVFASYASQLVLVNADFPRQKKNKLSPEQEKQNKDLAALYNPNGLFPLTLLIDTNGKEIRRWVGEVGDATAFVNEIRNACTSSK